MSRFLYNSALFFEALKTREVRRAIKILEEGELGDRSTVEEIRDHFLQNLFRQAWNYSSYYRKLLEERKLSPSDFKAVTDLRKIPFLKKDIIKLKRSEILSSNISDALCLERTSGGTTGEPIKVDVDKQARLMELYAFNRGLKWMGYTIGDPMIKFFGGSMSGNNSPTIKNRLKKFVSGEIFLPAFRLNKENAAEYLQIIKNVGQTHLQGYVSTLYTLALYAQELNYKGLRISGCFTTAEQLPDDQAAFISNVFNCEVKSFYGCAEINCLGFQILQGGPYIVPEEIVYIEQEKDRSNSFLLTSLHNYKTPMIRYLNGDSGTLGHNGKYLTIEILSGRTADMFIRRDGSLVSSIVATQTMQITGLTHKIKRYQFIQTESDLIEFRYEPFIEPLEEDELTKIIGMYSKRFGEEFTIKSNMTNNFIKSSNGKHRLMIRQI